MLADIAPGVDVDGGERLGLLDDDVAAALEPDLAPERPADLHLQPEVVEDRFLLVIEFDGVLHLWHERGDELDDLVVLGLGVHHDPLDRLGQDVAQHLLGHVEIGVDQGWRAGLVLLLDDLVPEFCEVVEVHDQVLLALAVGDGPDDEPASDRLDPVDDLLQPLALDLVLDPSRDADVIDGRHVDQVPPREGDVGRDACPLGPDRFLGDLHQQFLPLLQQFLDRMQRVGHWLLPRLPFHVRFVFLHRVEDVRHVEEGGLFQPDVDERRLHAGQHPDHLALVDVPDDSLHPAPLDVQLRNGAVLDERDAGFVGGGVDYQLVSHANPFLYVNSKAIPKRKFYVLRST